MPPLPAPAKCGAPTAGDPVLLLGCKDGHAAHAWSQGADGKLKLKGTDLCLAIDADEQDEADAEAALLKSKDLGEQGIVDADDIFALLDQDGNGELKMEEFMRLFDVLNFPLSDNQKERLFAYSDVSGTGTITDGEFKEGWEEMVRVFLEQSSREFGLTDMQIYGVVFMILVILLLLFVFLFLALSGWYSERGFEAVVQTTLVAGLGKTTAYLRQRSKVENADDLEQIVADIMDNQEDSASGD